jgi:hypothetical protein
VAAVVAAETADLAVKVELAELAVAVDIHKTVEQFVPLLI